MNPSFVVVFGTRPEVMKVRPVIDALRERGARVTCWLTGQHSDLLAHTADTPRTAACVRETIKLRIPPNGDPHEFSADVRRTVSRRLCNLAQRPDAVIVQGDTASAHGAALAAHDLGIPLAHVESGVRSFHDTPDPEEGFRVAIDALSAYRFAATQTTASNCTGLPGVTVMVGNTIVDDLKEEFGIDRITNRVVLPRVLVTLHRRETWVHLPALVEALDGVAGEFPEIEFLWPVHPNPVVGGAARRVQNIVCVPALGVRSFRAILSRSQLAVTDSGGVTEEAATMGVYTLIVRDHNDRPEVEMDGGAMTVGTDPETVARHLRRSLAEPPIVGPPSPLYGDGHAAPRIADVLVSAWTLPEDGSPGGAT